MGLIMYELTYLLGTGIATSQWYFDGDGHDAGVEAAVEGADKADGIAIRVHQGHSAFSNKRNKRKNQMKGKKQSVKNS